MILQSSGDTTRFSSNGTLTIHNDGKPLTIHLSISAVQWYCYYCTLTASQVHTALLLDTDLAHKATHQPTSHGCHNFRDLTLELFKSSDPIPFAAKAILSTRRISLWVYSKQNDASEETLPNRQFCCGFSRVNSERRSRVTSLRLSQLALGPTIRRTPCPCKIVVLVFRML